MPTLKGNLEREVIRNEKLYQHFKTTNQMNGRAKISADLKRAREALKLGTTGKMTSAWNILRQNKLGYRVGEDI